MEPVGSWRRQESYFLKAICFFKAQVFGAVSEAVRGLAGRCDGLTKAQGLAHLSDTTTFKKPELSYRRSDYKVIVDLKLSHHHIFGC